MAEVAQPAFPNRQHQVVAGVDGRFPVLLARDGVHAPVVEASDEFLYILSEVPGLTGMGQCVAYRGRVQPNLHVLRKSLILPDPTQ